LSTEGFQPVPEYPEIIALPPPPNTLENSTKNLYISLKIPKTGNKIILLKEWVVNIGWAERKEIIMIDSS